MRLVVLTSLLCAPGVAAAQEAEGALEEIVVTSRKRQERAQETPVAVTAVTGDQLRELGALRLGDLAVLAPNVRITTASGSGNAPAIFIRGIGTVTAAMYAEPAIGLYVDGVYMPRPTGNATDLPDVERLEVLRGPQGTLFGRNTTGGALMIATETPRDEASARVELGYGSNDEWVASGVIHTGELGGEWRAKVSGQVHSRDGWIRTPGYGRSDWGGNESGRNAGLALAGSLGALTIDNRSRYARVRSFTGWQILSGNPNVLAALRNAARTNADSPPLVIGTRPQDISYRDPRIDEDAVIESWGNVLTLGIELSDALTLKSTTGYGRLTQEIAGYLGGSYVLGPVLNPAVPGQPVEPMSFHATLGNPGDHRQWSQELQANGEFARGDYVAGVYLWDEKVDEHLNTILGALTGGGFVRTNRHIDYRQRVKSWAGFAHVRLRPAFLDGLELSTGFRYTHDEKAADSRTVQTAIATTTTTQAIDGEWGNWGYSGTLSYAMAPDVLAYARVASSYRAGGFNPMSTGSPAYDPEVAVGYEAGIKAELFDRRLRINANIFRTDYDDLQVNQYNTTTLTNFIANAGEARYDGFEIEGAAAINEHVRIDANLGHVDPRYREYLLIQGGVPINVSDQAHFAFVPHWTGRIGALFQTTEQGWGRLSLRTDYALRSSTRLAVINMLAPTLQGLRSGRDEQLSARLTWSRIAGSALSAQLYGENLTNNQFINFATDFSSIATANFNRARRMGVRLTAEF